MSNEKLTQRPAATCPDCKGKGKLQNGTACPPCKGRGKLQG